MNKEYSKIGFFFCLDTWLWTIYIVIFVCFKPFFIILSFCIVLFSKLLSVVFALTNVTKFSWAFTVIKLSLQMAKLRIVTWNAAVWRRRYFEVSCVFFEVWWIRHSSTVNQFDCAVIFSFISYPFVVCFHVLPDITTDKDYTSQN